jgi:polysaccharide export outer membrane protein
MRDWGIKTATAGLILGALLVQSCTLIPGMKMKDNPADKRTRDLPPTDEGAVVEVQTISNDLINQLTVDQKMETRLLTAEFSEPSDYYLMGPGDILQITVWDHPELTIPAGSFRNPEDSGQQIGDDGSLYYPFVGVIQADGMTVPELREVLTERLATYIKKPQLDVRVVAYRSKKVYVVGEVNDPGVLPLDDLPMMITDAINLSGGLTSEADKTGVNVSRNGKTFEINLKSLYDYADTSQNMTLTHGDIVNVLDRSQQKVFMMGEVKTPGAVEIINGRLTLAAALGEGGGVNQVTADPAGIYVIRGSNGDEPQIFRLDSNLAFGMLLAERFEMKPQDVVFVDTAGVSQWNRVVSQLLPSFTIGRIVNDF